MGGNWRSVKVLAWRGYISHHRGSTRVVLWNLPRRRRVKREVGEIGPTSREWRLWWLIQGPNYFDLSLYLSLHIDDCLTLVSEEQGI